MDAINQPLLDVRDLSVAFGNTLAVDRVSFSIKRGECVALVGESGSGKSVSALSILKLLPYPSASHPSGHIRFRGRDLLTAAEGEMREIRGNDISIIFQEPMTSLNPLHTIEAQIGEILLLHRGVSGAAARARTLELLTQVGIPDPETRLKSYPHQLSGGQRQRVMIAMALANEPGTNFRQQRQDLGLHGDVERGGRLVGDQDVGLAGERDGDHDALALAAG